MQAYFGERSSLTKRAPSCIQTRKRIGERRKGVLPSGCRGWSRLWRRIYPGRGTLVPEAIYGGSEERSEGEENDFSSPSLRSSLSPLSRLWNQGTPGASSRDILRRKFISREVSPENISRTVPTSSPWVSEDAPAPGLTKKILSRRIFNKLILQKKCCDWLMQIIMKKSAGICLNYKKEKKNDFVDNYTGLHLVRISFIRLSS